MIDLDACHAALLDEVFGNPGLRCRFRRVVAFVRDGDDLIAQSQRIEDLRTARQKRTDPHGHASRSELSVSAHLPSPSHTRSVKGNSSRSFSLALRSSQIFSTDGYSRESFHDRWSQCASTPRRPSFRSAKSTTMPPLTCPW